MVGLELAAFSTSWAIVGFAACYVFVKKHKFKIDIKKHGECIPTPPIVEEPKEVNPNRKGIVVERYDSGKYVCDNVYFPNAESYEITVDGDFTDIIFYADGCVITDARFRTSDIKAIY